MLIPDDEADVDFLNYEAIAGTAIELLSFLARLGPADTNGVHHKEHRRE